MKKIFIVMMMAIVAMTSVFASVNPMITSRSNDVYGTAASAEVSMKIKPEDVSFFRFGFTADTIMRPSMDREPTPLQTIDLTMSEDRKKATNEGIAYVYYLIQAPTQPVLTLEAGKGLKRSGSTKTIGYEITVEGQTAKSGGEGIQIPMRNFSNEKLNYGSYAMQIETTTPITPDMASETEDWKDTITLTITAGV